MSFIVGNEDCVGARCGLWFRLGMGAGSKMLLGMEGLVCRWEECFGCAGFG